MKKELFTRFKNANAACIKVMADITTGESVDSKDVMEAMIGICDVSCDLAKEVTNLELIRLREMLNGNGKG